MNFSNPQIDIHVYNEFSHIPLDQRAWDDLVEHSDVGGVFLKHFWVSSWWRHFGGPFQLYFVTAQVGEKVLAFMPLMIDENRTLRFIGDRNADYLGFVIPAAEGNLLGKFIEFLGDKKMQWDTIHLRNLPRDSFPRDVFIEHCHDAALYPWNNYSVPAPFLGIAGHEPEVTALLRKESFRRSERQLSQQGRLTFEVFATAERANEFWELYSQQHIDRCAQANRPSNFSDPAYLPFLKSLFESDRGGENVQFCALFMDDRPIAFHFGFISKDRLLWYKPSFDVGIVKGSPGVTLTCNLIRMAQLDGISELDFTIGDEPFKSRFCSKFRIVDEYRIHRSRLKFLVDTGRTRLRRAAKALIKSSD